MARLHSLRSILILLTLSLFIAACGSDDDDPDRTPRAFSFTAQTGLALSTAVESGTTTITGIDRSVSISITGGEYRINGGAYTSEAGRVSSGQTVEVRLTTSSEFSTAAVATVTAGGVSGTFSATTLAQDITPEAFSFTSVTSAALSTQTTSATTTLSGLNDAAAVTVSGGEYSVNGGTFTSDAGTIFNGQTIALRLTSSPDFASETIATLTAGGVNGAFSVTTFTQDTTPNAFSFTTLANLALSAQAESATSTVAGINDSAAVTIDVGEYSIDGGTFTSDAGSIVNGQTIAVRVTASSSFATTVRATLTIGGVNGTFDATTVAQDITPDAFTFTDVIDIELSTLTISGSITVAGINDASAISVSAGAEYNIDGGAFTSTAGNVANGQTVEVRDTSSASVSTGVDVTLTIGGVNDIFTITTIADTTAPTVAIAFPPPASMTEGATVTVRGTATDDFSTISSLQVNGIDVTDDSGDSSFSTWSVSVPLADGENTLTVSVEDSASNTDTDAASVAVRRDAALGDFPDSVNPLSYATGIAIDYSRNRALISDRDLDTIFTMDLATGARGILSNSLNEDLAFPFLSPEGLLVDVANDRLWVGDISADIVFSVSLADGTRTVVSSDTVPDTLLTFTSPREMVVNPNDSNELLISDQGGGIKSMNISTGARAVFSKDPIPNDENILNSANGIVLDIDRNRLLVADNAGNTGRMVAVDLDSRERTYISTSTIPNSDSPLLGDVRTIVLDLDRNRALVNNVDSVALIAVDLDSGVRSMFSDATFPDAINAAVFPQEVFFDGNLGYAFWVDRTLDAVLAVDILSGERVFITRGDSVD